MTIHTLPTELICEIFESLHCENIRSKRQDPDATGVYRTFASLARTCRRLYPIAKQFLYQRYDGKLYQAHLGFLRQVGSDPILPRYVKHIRADCITQKGKQYVGRSLRELRPAAERLLGSYDDDVDALIWKNPLDIEVAVLVALAANVETLEIKNNDRKYGDRKCPPWLFPILEAAHSVPGHIHKSYEKLHTLKIGLWMTFGDELGYLFKLPALRRLYMERLIDSPGYDNEPSNWPVQAGTSRIHTLKFCQPETSAEPIIQMMLSCKALKEFSCSRGVGTLENQRLFFTALVSALEPHADSLKSLWLRASAKPMKQLRYHRIEGFHRFHALKLLRVPFALLMGEPGKTFVNESWQLDEHWGGYPEMRNVLPPRLQKLAIEMCEESVPIERCEDVLTSLLPLDLNDNQHIKNIKLVYEAMEWNEPLPMDFWAIKDTYHTQGIDFDYCIRNSSSDSYFFLENTPKDVQIDGLAKELAKHGPRGVEMADHLEMSPAIVKAKVMELLGLDQDWLKSDKGRRIMFT